MHFEKPNAFQNAYNYIFTVKIYVPTLPKLSDQLSETHVFIWP